MSYRNKLYLIVFNPTAGYQSSQRLSQVCEKLGHRDIDYSCVKTSGELDNDIALIKQSAEHFHRCVVIGGDGTLHLVVNALARTNVELVVIPAGSGNDFARMLYSTHQNPMDSLFSNTVISVDLGLCNQRYFINVLGAGFDGALIQAMSASNKPAKSYTWESVKQLFCYQEREIMVEGDATYQRQALMLTFANGQYFGEGMQINPKAQLDSGYLDCCFIDKAPLWKKLWCMSKLFNGTHTQVSEVTTGKGREFHIVTQGIPLEADGEFLGLTPARISLIAGGIQVCLPDT